MKGPWQIMGWPKVIAFVVKCFVTVRGIISILLIGGIFLDLNLISVTQEGGHFINYFQHWPVTLAVCIALIVIHELVFGVCEKRLDREIKGTGAKEGAESNNP